MSKTSEQLTFFCQLCDENISGNICPTHGIDFVTIKRISAPPSTGQRGKDDATQRINGMLQIEQEVKANEPGREKQLMAQGDNKTPYLPVIPTETGEDKSLQPLAPETDPVADPAVPEVADEPLDTPVAPERPKFNDVDYQELAEETPAAHFDPAPAEPSLTVVSSPSKRGLIAAVVGIIAIIALAGVYFSIYQDSDSASLLYSEAERFYNVQNYPEALKRYRQLIAEHPGDPLAAVAKAKIVELDPQAGQPVILTPEQQQQIKELTIKANLAFQNSQFLIPKDDNVITYTQAILKIDPTNPTALKLQEEVIRYFESLAEMALQNGDFDKGLGVYRTILEIRPNDIGIKQKMFDVLEMKSKLSQD